MADEYQELTLKYYCSCLVETLSISNRTRLWLTSPVFGSLGSMVATWIKEFTNWFEIAHFRYKNHQINQIELETGLCTERMQLSAVQKFKKKSKNRIFYMCIQIVCILETEASVQMSQLRIKEWPSHRPPVTQKKNKRLGAVYKTSWTTQPSHRAQTPLDYE